MPSPSRVLITGGGGLVGLNTARALAAEGTSVVITARHGHDQIEKALGDFRELVTIEPVEFARSAEVFDLFSRYDFQSVIHAAQSHQHAQTRTANRGNYDMIFNCLEAAEATGVKRFVLVSSIAVYGGMAPPFAEDTRFPVQATIDDHPDAMGALSLPDGSRVLALPAFEVTVKRSLERIALDYAAPWQMGGSATVRANQKLNQHLLDVAVLRIPTQFGPGYKEMGSPISRAVHTVAGRGNLMAGAGYMGVPVAQLWSLIAVSPLTYVRDTANALAGIDSGRCPSASHLQPVKRIHHQCARTVAGPLPDKTGRRGTGERGSGNASGGAVSVERIQRGSTDPRHRVASAIHVRRSA